MPDFSMDLVNVEDSLDQLIRYREYLKVIAEDYLPIEAREIILWHYLEESDRLLKEAKLSITKARKVK